MSFDILRVDRGVRSVAAAYPELDVAAGIGDSELHAVLNRKLTMLEAAGAFRWQIDYLQEDGGVALSRAIEEIAPGAHTELAFWMGQAVGDHMSGSQSIHVLAGRGSLHLAKLLPRRRVDKEDSFITPRINLQPRITPEGPIVPGQVTLPPGYFYSIEAATDSPEPLVVTRLYAGGNRFDSEIPIHTDDVTLNAQGTEVPVPAALRERFAA